MTRSEYMLMVLAAADGKELTPVQLQKLCFLIDRKLGSQIGGPYYSFEPYDYGPFDRSVYYELNCLAGTGDVEILSEPQNAPRRYRPTYEGLSKGQRLLNDIPQELGTYLRELAAWVRKQSFASLVSSIYQQYPDMKANSVFKD